MKVGFIGAGRMGTPMVGRLISAGHAVTVLARTDERRGALADLGATPVGDALDVAAGADVVVVCVFTDEQVRAVAPGLISAMSEGTVLVLHTTGNPGTAEALAEQAAGHRVEVLDAPVSGGPHDVAAGTVTLFVGGTEDAVRRAGPVLAAYAGPVLHTGPIGSGQKVKLVNNVLFTAQIGLVAEAVRLGTRLGVAEPELLAALPHGSGASRAMANIARAGSVEAFIGAVGEFIGKDVAVARHTAAELGAGLGRLDGLVDAGLGL